MTDTPQSQLDIELMRLAISMGRRGLGRTAPNPSVGAVLFDPRSQVIIARGWTQTGGRPHAEPHAIAQAGEAANGSTLYVTLEPCSHHGRSPPCVDAIVAAGITRVVCGLEDPDPRVAGRGIDRLRQAGIAVEVGVLRKDCHQLALGHILRVTERRPFVQLKMALDEAGTVPRGAGGEPTWVTGIEARKRGHLLRAQSDAILVGSKTLLDDDPSLTCRLPGLEEQSPVRVILAGVLDQATLTLRAMAQSEVPVWWVAGRTGNENLTTSRSQDQLLLVNAVGHRPWLPAVMEALVQNGITRLLVEGGPTIWRAFDRANLVDEVVMFRSTRNKENERWPFEPGQALASYVHHTPMRIVNSIALSQDQCFVFRRGSIPLWWVA